MRQASSLLLLGASAFITLSGCNCGDPCDPDVDPPFCDGNTAVSCPQPGVDQLFGANRWRHEACGPKVCVMPDGGGPFCALSAEPNPLCADGVTRACGSGTVEVRCTRGFPTHHFDCLQCESTDEGANCIGGPSARCDAGTQCASGACSALGYCSAPADGGA